jgi:excisionase family DNA binding protein
MVAAIADLDKVRRMEPVTASPEAQPALEQLERVLTLRVDPPNASASETRIVGPAGDSITLPDFMYPLVARLVEVLKAGDAVTIVPIGKELTTKQAADLLNVSRQYLVRLLDEGKIAFHRIGAHRRVRIEDLLSYRAARDEERARQLDELTATTEDLDGYPELR